MPPALLQTGPARDDKKRAPADLSAMPSELCLLIAQADPLHLQVALVSIRKY